MMLEDGPRTQHHIVGPEVCPAECTRCSYFIPGGTFHTARVIGRAALVSRRVDRWPGVEPADVELGNADALAAKYPEVAAEDPQLPVGGSNRYLNRLLPSFLSLRLATLSMKSLPGTCGKPRKLGTLANLPRQVVNCLSQPATMRKLSPGAIASAGRCHSSTVTPAALLPCTLTSDLRPALAPLSQLISPRVNQLLS